MEFITTNKRYVKHWITVNTMDNTLRITRLRTPGGVPQTIVSKVDSDIGLGAAIRKIKNIIEFDDELYDIMTEHTKL